MTNAEIIDAMEDGLDENADVWMIQFYSKEFDRALSHVQGDKNFLLCNCVCNFNIGEVRVLSRQFDKVIFSKEGDCLIFVMRGSDIGIDIIHDKLEEKDIYYDEVDFSPLDDEFQDKNIFGEIWYAREVSVLDEALTTYRDTHGENSLCTYYPNLQGSLDVGYVTNGKYEVNQVITRNSRGVVILEDKSFILLDKNITIEEVYAILDKNHCNCITLNTDSYPEELDKEILSRQKRPKINN